MKIPTRQRERGLNFNVTPLIDIVFLLIIFFLAASHLARSELVDDVALPSATEVAEEVEQPPRRLTVTVTAARAMSVAGQPVDIPTLEQLILAGHLEQDARGFEVRIRGDAAVPYDAIEPILLACARAGVSKTGFAVLPE